MLVRVAQFGTCSLLLIAACALFRLTQPTTDGAPLSAGRNVPWNIAPRYDVPQIATDEQLLAVLERLKPQAGPETNQLIHALRLWGPAAEFGDDSLSGQAMLAFCLDDRQFCSLAGGETPPLVQVSTAGARVRSYRPGDDFARSGSLHPDDLLATLAESGVPLDTEVTTRDGATSVRALLETALRRYHVDQFEHEWTAICYARYLFPTDRWTNDYGQSVRMETLVRRLMDEDLWRGVCLGTHRLEALVVLLRADEQAGGLTPRLRQQIIEHLTQVSRRLVQSQHTTGYWNQHWHEQTDPATRESGTRAEQILATGHHLEWLALAPPEVLPPREVLVRAGQWLVRAIQEVDEETLRVEYGPFTHAGRALCLWRGRSPWEVWQQRSNHLANES